MTMSQRQPQGAFLQQYRTSFIGAFIVSRADAHKEHMWLTTWKEAPHGKIQIFDVVVAKNYLTDNELAQLERLVSAYLELAESMALRKIPMTMKDWEVRLNRFIAATDREILQDAGKVSAEIAQAHAESEFEKYRIGQDRLFQSDFDKLVQSIGKKENRSELDHSRIIFSLSVPSVIHRILPQVPMPLVNISLRSIYTPAKKQAIHTAIHEALVESFMIPDHDYHHRMHTFEECDYPIAPGKTARSILIEMLVFPGRSDQAKENLYAGICKRLEALGTAPADVQIVLIENPLQNWGFGGRSAAKMDLGFNLKV